MKQRLINYLLRNVVRVIVPDDVISESKGALYLGGLLLTEQEKQSLNAEAKALSSMRIWSIIGETTKQICYDKGWKTSTTMEHLNVAKSMYAVLEVQQSIVKKLESVI